VAPAAGTQDVVQTGNSAEQRAYRPRDILQLGMQNHHKGEYEVADVYLKKTQEMRSGLSAAEQTQLDEFLKRNSGALAARKQGQDQIKKATDALNAGRYQEANAHLMSLRVNVYLSQEDRKSVNTLSETMAKNTGAANPVAPMTPKNPADMIAQARVALNQNKCDEAEMLVHEAVRAGYVRKWYELGKEDPEKMLAEAQQKRSKMGGVAKLNPNAPMDQRQQQARTLCMQANQALAAGDLPKAEALTRQAEDLNCNLPWFDENTPQKMRENIAKAKLTVKVDASPRGVQASASVTLPADPRVALKQAQEALDRGQIEVAEQLANHARMATNAGWGMFEMTPDKMLGECARTREKVNGKRAAELLVTARVKIDAGQLDEAEKLVSQSMALRPIKDYSLLDSFNGERPEKMMQEIRAKQAVIARNKPLPSLNEPAPGRLASAGATVQAQGSAPVASDPKVADANRLMVEARMHLNKGEYEVALKKASMVKSMGVVTQDKPEDIFVAVEAIQKTQIMHQQPAVADVTRTKGLQLVANARLKAKSGDILGARKDAMDAKALNAVYRAGDDLPENVLAELQAKAKEQVETYSKAADTLAQRGRAGEAQNYRNYVMNVAMTFNVTAPSAKGTPGTLMPMNATDVAGQGKKLCTEVETCMKEGQLAQARKLANALYEGPYGMKQEAGQYLAQLDAAEHKAAIKDAEKYYELMTRCCNRGEYLEAREYAAKVNMKLLDEGKAKHYQELMTTINQQKPVVQMAAAVEGPAKQGSGQSALLDETRKKQEIESQRLHELKMNSLAKANRMSQQSNLEGAIAELKGTLETVKKADPDVPKVVEMCRQLESKIKLYEKLNEQVALEKMQKDKLEARANAQLRKAKDEENRINQVTELMKQCKAYYKDGKYAEAEAAAEKAHAIDPDNMAVSVAWEQARRMGHLADEEKIVRTSADGQNQALRDVGRGAISNVGDDHPLLYDESFPDKSGKRLIALKERLQKDKYKKQELPNSSRMQSTVSVDFRNKPLEDVIGDLSRMSGVNIDIDNNALAYAHIDPKTPISKALIGVPLSTALELVLRDAQLTYYVYKGVVTVSTKEGSYKYTSSTRRYPVHDLIVPRDDMARLANVNGGESVYNNVNTSSLMVVKNDGSVLPNSTGPQGSQARNGEWQRHTGQTLEKDLMKLITSTIERDSWIDSGGQGVMEYYPLGMTLVVTQANDIQEQIEDLLRRLRELQEVQVTVEVRVLSLSEDFFERMGVNFNLLLPAQHSTAFNSQVANANFAPNGQLNVIGDPNAVVGLTPNGNFTNTLQIPISNDSFNQARLPVGFAGIGPPGSSGGLDIGIAFLSSIEAFLVIEAVQGDVRNNVLQAPKITLFNGQTATISSTTEQLFVTSVTAIPNFFTGIPVFIPVQTPFPTGITLTVQAVVTHDRRYVQLTLAPNITNTTDSGRSFQAVAGITLQQPIFSIITVSTSVMVPDGGTILVGGLKNMNEQRREFGPPILSKIPYIKRLFANDAYGRSATSFMFMVTPRIIINEEEEEKLGNTNTFSF
jgi:type II secretory pathway component GspD/PulD (secretin)